MKIKNFMTAGIIFSMIFLIPACMQDTETPEKGVGIPTSTAESDNLNNSNAAESSEAETPTTREPAQDESAEDNQRASTPTVRSGLEATDPDSVKIAAGDVQLIEFFAFW
ncbi:MAG: hypothetical protein KGY46_00690 [Anaerolineales bacterium]|nr:hypothetical protein [Anaerolineales bacterium]